MPVGEEWCVHSINSTTQTLTDARARAREHTHPARVLCNNETVSQFDEVPANSDTMTAGIVEVIDCD